MQQHRLDRTQLLVNVSMLELIHKTFVGNQQEQLNHIPLWQTNFKLSGSAETSSSSNLPVISTLLNVR
jgi:hypothetical protein